MKNIFSVILGVIFTFGSIAMFTACGEQEKYALSDCYCVFTIGGDTNVTVSYGGHREITLEYTGNSYGVYYAVYYPDGTPASEANERPSIGPSPGEYDCISLGGDFSVTVEIVPPKEKETPEWGFEPNGAIRYEENKRYVYEYDGFEHYPYFYGMIDGKKLRADRYPDESIVSCIDSDGRENGDLVSVGEYTVTFELNWAYEEDRLNYTGISATIVIEIIDERK